MKLSEREVQMVSCVIRLTFYKTTTNTSTIGLSTASVCESLLETMISNYFVVQYWQYCNSNLWYKKIKHLNFKREIFCLCSTFGFLIWKFFICSKRNDHFNLNYTRIFYFDISIMDLCYSVLRSEPGHSFQFQIDWLTDTSFFHLSLLLNRMARSKIYSLMDAWLLEFS